MAFQFVSVAIGFANCNRHFDNIDIADGRLIASVKTPETWLVFAERIVSRARCADRISCQGDLFCMVRSLTWQTSKTGSKDAGLKPQRSCWLRPLLARGDRCPC